MVSMDRSYRALLAIPELPRILTSMQLARVAHTMSTVAIVLFTLIQFRSPVLAGVVTFASLTPGILLSQLVGALLDRHGRIGLVRLDYVIALTSMVLIGGLSILDQLSPLLLIVIAAVSSATGPLSQTGLRSLFPLIVPSHLWERVNALDSNGYLLALILGPPIAAVLLALYGPAVAVMCVGVPYLLAAVALVGVREPMARSNTSGSILGDARDGLAYVMRNRTIRGLAVSISLMSFGGGIGSIVIPVLVLDRLGGSEILVGISFALTGVAGMASVLFFGRVDSRGREWELLVYPMVLVAPVTALLLLANTNWAAGAPVVGLSVLFVCMLLRGLLNGSLDIGLFTIRQRRTDTSWMGRAFAISMAINMSGYPIGAAVAGVLATDSLDVAILFAVVAYATGAVSAALLVPRHDPARPVRSASRLEDPKRAMP